MEDQGQGQEGGAPSPEEIVKNVAETIGALAQAASQQMPDVAKQLQQIQQQFMQVMSAAMQKAGGGGGGSQGQSQAMPDRSQGMPVGPQGAM
jgi:hypothetical protein